MPLPRLAALQTTEAASSSEVAAPPRALTAPADDVEAAPEPTCTPLEFAEVTDDPADAAAAEAVGRDIADTRVMEMGIREQKDRITRLAVGLLGIAVDAISRGQVRPLVHHGSVGVCLSRVTVE